MKRLIYQVYTGKRSKLYDHCTASVKAYAERINKEENVRNKVDYIVQTQPIMRIKPDVFVSNRSTESYEKYGGFLPIYEKENAFTYLNQYEQIAIIDSDIYIRQEAPNIFWDLTEEYAFGAVAERELPCAKKYKSKIKKYSKAAFENITDVDWKWNNFGGHFYNMGLMLMNRAFVKYLPGKLKV